MSEPNGQCASDTEQLEYGTDYEYRCRTCGEESSQCDCGNPYYDTVLKTVEIPDAPKSIIHERKVRTDTEQTNE